MRLLDFYDDAVSKSPILTQIIMAFIVTSIGDILAQRVFERPIKNYSGKRTIKFALIGAFYAAPVLAVWLIFLDNYFGEDFSTMKLVVDQLFMNPIITGGFIWLNGISNGIELNSSWKLIINDLPRLMLKSWPYWTFVSFVNFVFIPLNYRLLIIKLASIAWNTFLSLFSKSANDRVLYEELEEKC